MAKHWRDLKPHGRGMHSPLTRLMARAKITPLAVYERINELTKIDISDYLFTLTPLRAYRHPNWRIIVFIIKRMLLEAGVPPDKIRAATEWLGEQPLTPVELVGHYGFKLIELARIVADALGISLSNVSLSRTLKHDVAYKHSRHDDIVKVVAGLLAQRGCPAGDIEKILYNKHSNIRGGYEMLPEKVLQYFGLKRQPFIDELDDESSLFWTPSHEEALESMTQAATNKAFIYVVGQIGNGKSTVKMVALERLRREHKNIRVFRFEEPEHERLLMSDIYKSILDRLGVRRQPQSIAQRLDLVKAKLETQFEKEGATAFIVIDEAQSLSYKAIAGLKQLYDTYYGLRRIVGICLIGTPELRKNIERDSRVESSAMRLSPVEIRGLGDYTVPYLRLKLDRAGADANLFTGEALAAIANEQRTMKEASKIASRAMDRCYEMKKQPPIDARLIQVLH